MVIEPPSLTWAGTLIRMDTSRSVPLIHRASSSVSMRTFERTGSVVRVGMLAATAANPL